MKKIPTKTESSFALQGLIFLALAALLFFFHIFLFSSSKSQPRISTLQAIPETVSAVPESMAGATRLALGQKIDLNSASVQDLEALQGVGLAMSERIVKKRQELGKFKTLEDLMQVKGIKDKKLESLKNFIEVR